MTKDWKSLFFLFPLTILSLNISQTAYAGPYTLGVRPECGASSSPIILSPLNFTYNLGANHTNPSMAPLQTITPWESASGVMVKEKRENNSTGCEDGSSYNPSIIFGRGLMTWVVADPSWPAAGQSITVDGKVYPIYKTNIDEIGYIILVNDVNSTAPSTPLETDPTKLWSTPRDTDNDNTITRNVDAQIMFITLEVLSSGNYTVLGGKAADVYMVNEDNSSSITSNRKMFSIPINYNGFNITMTTSTCAVSTQTISQTVVMPTLGIDIFNGIGSTAGSANFMMTLDCGEGIAAYVTLTDANDNSNRSDILSLSHIHSQWRRYTSICQ